MGIEPRLCDLFGYRRAVVFAHARGGIATLLSVLGARKLYGPANCCPAVVYAAHAARAEYVPMPTDPATGDAQPFDRIVDGSVYMHTHLYGAHNPTPLPRTSAFCLENDTLAVSASRQYRGVCDAMLVSFGANKTIVAQRGGAILTDDASLAVELLEATRLYTPTDPAYYTEANYRLCELRAGSAIPEDFLEVETSAVTRKLVDCNWETRLASALNRRHEIQDGKRRNWDMWLRALQTRGVLSRALDCTAPWRFTCTMTPAVRDKVARALRAAGFDAGTNYPNLCRSFPKMLGVLNHTNNDIWAASVLQLWLTEDYTYSRIERGADIIQGVFDENLGRAI